MNKAQNNKAVDIALIGMFTAIITICSWISIPFTVPITMQTFGIFLTIGLLGIKKSLLSLTIYVFLGIIGLPVFANFNSGITTLAGPTGGYMLGFFLIIIITGALLKKEYKSNASIFFSMFISQLSCYIFGTLWFSLVYLPEPKTASLTTILVSCVFPFIIPDIVKILVAITVMKRLKRLSTS